MGITAKCPKGKESLLAMPSPQEIESLVCKLATQKQIEDKAVTEICSMISKKLQMPDCHVVLERVWDKVAAMCPTGQKSKLALPSGQEIEKLVCELATQKQIEDKASTAVCSLIKKKLRIPDCQDMVEHMWNQIIATCPNGRETTLANPISQQQAAIFV